MSSLGRTNIERDLARARAYLAGSFPIWIPFVSADVLASGISTNGASPFSASVPRALTLTNWSQSAYVATTNDGSNYWKIALYRYPSTGGVKLLELSTASMSAATWTVLSGEVNGAVLATDLLIYINVTKTGSPGNLSLGGPMVLAR